jgi:RHS repeat-associated protein
VSPWGTSDSLSTKFTAQERDSNDTGLDFFQARYHASGQGRFLSADSLGASLANPADPQTWNQYAYVRNNPLAFVDPSGHQCVWDNGSYDSADDPESSGIGGCTAAGGTWFDPNTFQAPNGDWSAQPNQGLADQIANSQTGFTFLAEGTTQVDPMSATGVAFLNQMAMWQPTLEGTVNVLGAATAGVAALPAIAASGPAIGAAARSAAFGPAAGRVFWSGAGAASAATRWAITYSGSTLEMTPAGRALSLISETALSLGADWSYVRPLWVAASTEFASGAEGPVMLFTGTSVSPASIWLNVELPTLVGTGATIVPGR